MRHISRRGFLGSLVGLVGAGVALAVARWRPSDQAAITPVPLTTFPPLAGGATGEPTPTTTAATSTTAPAATTATPVPTTTTSVPILPVICKQAWGARPVPGEFTRHTIERLTVHHTAVFLESNTRAPARARRHQRFHQDKGWPDLAYHFLIDANGHLYEGRPVDAVGDTATDYDPRGHFLVSCEGDFDRQQVPDRQLATLVATLAWAAVTFDVDPGTIRGHRDLAATSCPGDNLYARIADGTLEGKVRRRVARGAPTMRVVCGEEGDQLVAAIVAGTA